MTLHASPQFQIIPAIDLMGGTCVRLEQGDAARQTRYSVPAPDVAQAYEAAGARRIHVVDLDGAFEGAPKNLATIQKIREACTVEIEVGGGIRDATTVQTLFDLGIDYVILGTKALEDPAFLTDMVAKYGSRIIVGADARNGMLATRGWTHTSAVRATDYLRELVARLGPLTVIYTDIARDGTFTSPNYDALREVLAIPKLEVIASGGVGSLDDIRGLLALNNEKLRGVIVGKALYDGRLSLADAIALIHSHRKEK
ncbi:MAG: 1-(5-phosphoribosyl)-5-[(5-phosphoribosylamino) methylideneamino] imidazole-4-carboxamide isomerase [Candidatus Sumerlaea sp.]|uniref:1-(5-phosphoribosyl)-5-[(5-phosphoribosylamino)methylideneamino] imidazole-4-carboxamide isomerase n=1 Tax=Sumerlaea chitinivorans TaxID=2250252 RepID=A0A2Z4Y5B1_SUMC1|nr:Phosphoribosylformimino-5-aminoimidazole carboxamide ribotide isomerase [Candidatus Sumerlaea chitinivorans]MCX7964359.1 1-(5-phosphoribosyl)-5-[(5-phosphoribosylamino)methylideneamino]imidazole-4-carboxamide isomerase [Candidatus Sumerlaea chitinivorans]GIX45086.1 MAG: 1-(5-phosphoribosyl)-5-[(5-phosphoribosylamino) methylideneamino] imidazole-4-carboxamide isomerase [Candidatus Sumerlaea sp.]